MVKKWTPVRDEDDLALFGAEELEPDLVLPPGWDALPWGPAHHDMPAGKCLYASPARGLAARHAEFELWCQAWGSMGAYDRSHAWRTGAVLGGGLDAILRDRCEPAALHCSLSRGWRWDARNQQRVPYPLGECGHDQDRVHRTACLGEGCDWEGPERPSERLAVEDGMDHAWPGWRDLPTVPRVPDCGGSYDTSAGRKAIASWRAKVDAVYPDGWLEAGGPIRTLRRPLETRHVENRTPWGGFDLAVPKTGPRGFPLCRGTRGTKDKPDSRDCGAEGIGPASPWCVRHWTADKDPEGGELARKLGLLPKEHES